MPDPDLKIQPGDVVLIRARVRAAHDKQGLLVVDISEAPHVAGPGYGTQVLSIAAVHSIEADPPTDRWLVPPLR